MSDDKTKRGKADRIRISVTQPWELRRWARVLGITQVRLREVVAKVGPMVAKVKAHLIAQIHNAR